MSVTSRQLGELAQEMKGQLLADWQHELGRDGVCRSALASYSSLWEALVDALARSEEDGLPVSPAVQADVGRTARREGLLIGQYIRGLQLWRDVVRQGLRRAAGLDGDRKAALQRRCRAMVDALVLSAHEIYPEATDIVQQIGVDLADHSNDMIFAVDGEGRFVFVNPHMRLSLGYRAEELLGTHFSEVIAPELRSDAAENFQRAMAGRRSIGTYELEYVARHGGRIPVELNVHTRRVGERTVGRVGIARDVTVRKNIQLELLQRNRELTAMNSIIAKVGQSLHVGSVLVEVLHSCMDTVGANGGAIYLVNEATREPECAACEGSAPPLNGEGDASEATKVWERICTDTLETGRYVAYSPHLNWDAADGAELLEKMGAGSCIGVPLRSEQRVHGVMAVLTAADNPRQFAAQSLPWLETVGRHIGVAVDNARLYAEARKMATTDSLTGLPHHGEFYRLLKDELERSRRYERPFCVVMMDLDDLKATNDMYGHLTGDEALRQCAQLLRDHVRHADAAARYGGDEFALILPETTADQAEPLARRIKVAIEEFDDWSSEQAAGLRLGISIGIAPFDGQDTDEDQLIDQADKACYAAKREGGGVTVADIASS